MPIFQFKCANEHLHEVLDLTYARVAVVSCPTCQEPASRVIAASNWQVGTGPRESDVSRAIGRVQAAGRAGRL